MEHDPVRVISINTHNAFPRETVPVPVYKSEIEYARGFWSTHRRIVWPTEFVSNLKKQRVIFQSEMKVIERELEEIPNPIPGMTYVSLCKTHQYAASYEFKMACDAYGKVYSLYESLLESIRILDDAIARHENRMLRTESGVVSEQTSGIPETREVKENFQDMGGDEPEKETMGMDYPSSIISHTDLTMSEWFSRPYEIASFTWTVGSGLNNTYDPWTLYFSAPSVRAKLKNYAFIFANLNLRVAVSGTPFHFGKMLVTYMPNGSLNEISQYYFASLTTDISNSKKYLSQFKTSFVMDPKDNIPLDIHCPFISTKRSIRLFNQATSAIAAGTAFDDVTSMGRLIFLGINNLGCDAASPTNANFVVYAWLSEVVLGPPTGTQLAITTESGVVDERKTGPVEKIASRTAQIAESLVSVPWISPFAKASAMVLRGLEGMSAIFGWSRPVMDTKPTRVKNEPFQNAATVIGYDTGKRIGLDPRGELTVDPRICATAFDEMAISHICSVTSYIDKFSWSTSAAAFTSLWTGMVTPRAFIPTVVATKYHVQPSALAYAAAPFAYWRGDITYRVEIACSNFHRGKLAVLFEPNVAQEALIIAALNINKQYICVIDLQETQVCEFTVEWAFTRDWARVCDNTLARTALGTTLASPANFFNQANGFITIFPLTKLQSPTAAAVDVNLYIRSDNMKFNFVNDEFLPLDITTESGVTSSYDIKACALNKSVSSENGINQFFFGESPTSFRSLLKRYCVTRVLTATSGGSGLELDIVTCPIIPDITPSWTAPVAPSTNLLSYLRYAYLGMKGSLRKRMRVLGAPSTGAEERTHVTLQPIQSTITVPALTFGAGMSTPTLNGTAEFITTTNGGVEVEFPFYTNNLFLISGNSTDWVGFPMTDTVGVRDYYYEHEHMHTANQLTFVEETATGEDFTLMHFLAAPPFRI